MMRRAYSCCAWRAAARTSLTGSPVPRANAFRRASRPGGQLAQPFRAVVGQDLRDERRTLVAPFDKRKDFPAG